MGGPGSGSHYHWWRADKKTAVEDCLSLGANRLTRDGVFRPGVHRFSTYRWSYRSEGSFTVHCEVTTLDPDLPAGRLFHSWVWRATKQPESADYWVRLTTTRPPCAVPGPHPLRAGEQAQTTGSFPCE